MIAEHNGERDELAEKVNDLLLPIVKGYGSERSWVLLGTESLQTFGGSGFLQEYPIEQYVRDAKIDTLYEGTTAIQGQDFFFRKIVKDQGARARPPGRRDRRRSSSSEAGNGRLKVERELLAKALEDAQAIVGHMISDLMSADASAEGGDIRNIYKVGLNTSRLLMALGDVVCAWLLLRQAEVALEKLGGERLRARTRPSTRARSRRRSSSPSTRAAEAHRRAGDRRGHRPRRSWTSTRPPSDSLTSLHADPPATVPARGGVTRGAAVWPHVRQGMTQPMGIGIGIVLHRPRPDRRSPAVVDAPGRDRRTTSPARRSAGSCLDRGRSLAIVLALVMNQQRPEGDATSRSAASSPERRQ